MNLTKICEGKLSFGASKEVTEKAKHSYTPNLVVFCRMYFALLCPSCSSSPLAVLGQSNSPPCQE
jgi:hypothetical protein